ncbi:MAG TPA: type II CAAX endopeptidase family protein [Candidatus Acidoferrales bacterium]|jgi:hypothetical protein|nr:type II CAAX endopeptidase family protein [Candidatus Acidoferrales bacterium]
MATPEYPVSAVAQNDRKLVAPLWHTTILVLVVVGISLTQAIQQQHLGAIELKSRLPLYFTQIAFELLLFSYVWLLGLKLTRTSVREIIGGRWASVNDFIRDIAAALGFWLVVAGVLLILNKILGQNTTIRTLQPLLPQTATETAVWIILCATAGFCEEFIFRGYLQKQFFAITGREGWAIVLQSIIFGAAHGYQGWKGMITIMIYGAMFGILADIRKSLRPGMMQHAGQDIFSGIVGSILTRRHYI